MVRCLMFYVSINLLKIGSIPILLDFLKWVPFALNGGTQAETADTDSGVGFKKGSAEAINPGTSLELISDSMLKLS